MASIDKLLRAFDALKLPSASVDDAQNRKKEKMQQCVVVGEALSAAGMRHSAEFSKMLSVALETLLATAGDADADVRMAADEALNVITRSVMEGSVGKVLLELHKELRRNGEARSVRAALWRFGALSAQVRPQKGRVYAQNVLPCLDAIARRPEELLHEALAPAASAILDALGAFATDAELKQLLRTLLRNANAPSAVVRRAAAATAAAVCLCSGKAHALLAWTARLALLPLAAAPEPAPDAVQGALGLCRLLAPHLQHAPDLLLQVFQWCLHFAVHRDHNVANAAMECLQQVLRAAPPTLARTLCHPAGLPRPLLAAHDHAHLHARTLSQLSVAFGGEEPPALPDDPDPHFPSPKLQVGLEPPKQSALDSPRSLHLPAQEMEVAVEESAVVAAVQPESELQQEEEEEEAATPEPPPEAGRERAARCCDVGSLEDAEVALEHCCRLLAHHFLLKGVPGGFWDDAEVRVSAKALALSCLAALFALHPHAIRLHLDKSQPESQKVWEVLHFSEHSDPQLQSLSSQVSCSVVSAVLRVNGHRLWPQHPAAEFLMQPLLRGLVGESAVSCHQTLAALAACLPALLLSEESKLALPLLHALPPLKSNPYWLVKVRLVELIAVLHFSVVAFVSGSGQLQQILVWGVVLQLLGDEDARVRTAAALALQKLVGRLHFCNDSPGEEALTLVARAECGRLLAPSATLHGQQEGADVAADHALSRLVAALSQRLYTADNKHLTFGCCEALAGVAAAFPPTRHPHAWGCIPPAKKKAKKDAKGEVGERPSCPAALLLSSAAALMASAQVTVDLSCQQHLLTFSTMLFQGLVGGGHHRKEADEQRPWLQAAAGSSKTAAAAEQLFGHVCSLLAAFSVTMEEVPAAKNVLNSLPSPLKRQKEAADNKGEEEKKGRGTLVAQLAASGQLLGLLQLIKSAHSNYKVSLEAAASAKLVALLAATLQALSRMLEAATVTEVGRLAEELLHHLKTTAALAPAHTVHAVQQLLRSLFGQKQVAAAAAPVAEAEAAGGLYEGCFAHHYRRLFSGLEAARAAAPAAATAATRLPEKRAHRDKAALASYIKLFEPVVIKALEQYTVTSDGQVQCAVLRLLMQLLQLRVNYCLLDSERVFIGFVLRQFELIEHGHCAEQLVPHVFRFLVQLSYEKNHSKPVIGVPEILQLCDGLVASGQPPHSHCIPALAAIVEDVFVARSAHAPVDASELDTQKEVLVAMLLRLVDHHEVLELLALVVREGGDAERVRRWASAAVRAVLPVLRAHLLRLEAWPALHSLLQLLRAVDVAEHLDALLPLLFAEPPSEDLQVANQRWLAAFSVILSQLLVGVEEERLLARIVHLNLDAGRRPDVDPLNAAATSDQPQVVFARLLFEAVETVMVRACALAKCTDAPAADFVQQQCAHLLFLLIYVLESGAFRQVAAAATQMAHAQQLPLPAVNALALQAAAFAPGLTLQWAYLLVLLGHSYHAFWTQLVGSESFFRATPLPCANLELVRRAGIIFFADLVCDYSGEGEEGKHFEWLLRRHAAPLLALGAEAPVREALYAAHRSPQASGHLLAACALAATPPPGAVAALAGLHAAASWPLLVLLASRWLPATAATTAVGRRVAALAARRAEMLLALPPPEAAQQVPRADLESLISQLDLRHERLQSLLIKIRSNLYGDVAAEAPLEHPATALVEQADEKWFFEQVQQRCCGGGHECSASCCAQLLSKLPTAQALLVMRHAHFRLPTLEKCVTLGATLSRKLSNGGLEASPLLNASHLFLCEQTNGVLQELAYEAQDGSRVSTQLWLKEEGSAARLAALAKAATAMAHVRWPTAHPAAIFLFSLVCLEGSAFSSSPSQLAALLQAAGALLGLGWTPAASHWPLVRAAASALCATVRNLLRSHALPPPPAAADEAALLLALLEQWRRQRPPLPRFLLRPLEAAARGVAALPPLFCAAATPPDAHRLGLVGVGGGDGGEFPALPAEALLEAPLLEQLIFRLNALGWWRRPHFEESWMAYLGALNATVAHPLAPDEVAHAQRLAVRGLTALLVRSLRLHGAFLHVPRGGAVPRDSRLDEIQEKGVADCNLERLGQGNRYGYGQLSLKFLSEAVHRVENPSAPVDELLVRREQHLNALGVDLHSCLHFLLEHYTQLLEPQSGTQVVVQVEVVRSVLMLSDVFTERSQYEWMLHKLLELSRTHPIEDELMHQLLTLGVCKAVALLAPEEGEVWERCRKLLEGSLRSGFLPARLSALQGLLVLVEGGHEAAAAVAADYAQRHLEVAAAAAASGHSERHVRTLWALLLQLVEGGEGPAEALPLAVALAAAADSPLAATLVEGLTRLVAAGRLPPHQVARLALSRLRSSRPPASVAALRLLLAAMLAEGRPADDPDALLQALEKIAALLDKVRSGYPCEAWAVCRAVALVLGEGVPASQLLTKVIGELLAPQQPHRQQLALLVFRLVGAACAAPAGRQLLQEWLCVCLANLTVATPPAVAVASLTCILLGASDNPCLTHLFPAAQGRVEPAILSLAAAEFHSRLPEALQAQFVATLSKGGVLFQQAAVRCSQNIVTC